VEKVRSAVWQPPTDGPAGRDLDVRAALAGQASVRDWLPRRWSVHVFVAAVCALAGLPVSTVLALAPVLVLGVAMVVFWLWVGRWQTAARQLLDREPARLVEYEPVGRRLVRIEQLLVRVHPGYQHGRLWLVGPNADGLAVVFFGASAYPRPAQVVRRRPRTGPPPTSRPRSPMWRARLATVCTAVEVATQWTYLVAITVSIGLELAPQPRVLAWLYAGAALVLTVLFTRRLRRAMPSLRARRLLTAPLAEYPARALPRRSVAVTLSDGTELVGTFRRNWDVLATVRASGRLWVAGTPAAGVTLGVGMPGHPIAGVVRFDSTDGFD
jgi:hypothetical protein